MRVLLILPAYNEQATIVKTVSQIRATTFSPQLQVDYMVINDGSTDNTEQLCLQHQIPCITLIQNLGIGGAVQTGYIFAAMHNYDIAVQFDGDGQHDIASLEALLQPLIDNTADFTVGSRFIDKSSSNFRSTQLRRIGIRFLSSLIRILTGMVILDVTSGYRAANREVLKYLANDYPVDYPEPESLVLLKKQNFRIKEIPVNMFEREGGTSTIRSFMSLYYMVKVTLSILCAALRKEAKK